MKIVQKVPKSMNNQERQKLWQSELVGILGKVE